MGLDPPVHGKVIALRVNLGLVVPGGGREQNTSLTGKVKNEAAKPRNM